MISGAVRAAPAASTPERSAAGAPAAPAAGTRTELAARPGRARGGFRVVGARPGGTVGLLGCFGLGRCRELHRFLGGLAHTASFITVSNPDSANASIGVIDSALKKVNKQRADLGAYQNRLDHARKGLSVGAENLQATESQIRDTDMAHETVSYVTNQILLQSSTAMLAQANQKAQSVLQLLQ